MIENVVSAVASLSSMDSRTRNQVIALSGLFQAVQLVKQLAWEGNADAHAIEQSLRSIFIRDTNDGSEIYPGGQSFGLSVLRTQLGGDPNSRDVELTRYGATLLHLERKLSSRELWVRVDSVQIEQVLINLLRNALDAMQDTPPQGRRLTIESGIQADGMVYVSVTDNGAGISGGNMEHLFDAFFSTKESGMGMGLAISQTIMNNHHGKIKADSWPGRGSRFTIELPPSVDAALTAAS